MKDFQALHRSHLLARNKVLEADLSVLVGAPGVQLAQDLVYIAV